MAHNNGPDEIDCLSRSHNRPQALLRPRPVANETLRGGPGHRSGFALIAPQTEHKQKDRRAEALRQLTAFVQNWPAAFQLARLCLGAAGCLDFTELDASVTAACAHKATSTIVRRLHRLTAYVIWSRLHDQQPFPPAERSSKPPWKAYRNGWKLM